MRLVVQSGLRNRALTRRLLPKSSGLSLYQAVSCGTGGSHFFGNHVGPRHPNHGAYRTFVFSQDSVSASETPPGTKIELDFFGEPVTFLGIHHTDKVSNAMAALDGFLLGAVTKGRTCTLGGDESGIFMKAPHSVAVAWSEALRFATFWNQPRKKEKVSKYDDEDEDNHNDSRFTSNHMRPHRSSPMLAVVAVSPLLANAGLSYTKHLDSLLKQTKPPVPGYPPVQMLDLAHCAVDRIDEPFLNLREKMVKDHIICCGIHLSFILTHFHV